MQKVLNCSICNTPVVVKLRAFTTKCETCKKTYVRPSKRKRLKTCECGNIFYSKSKKSKYCFSCRSRIGGLASAKANVKRSRHEKYFYELCNNTFSNVIHNETIFNGWDADIILQNEKIAVLWNGVWHYKKCNKKHSVLQVQNRDRIKRKIITSCGYIVYIIKDDMRHFQKQKVEEKFKRFENIVKFIAGGRLVSQGGS